MLYLHQSRFNERDLGQNGSDSGLSKFMQIYSSIGIRLRIFYFYKLFLLFIISRDFN